MRTGGITRFTGPLWLIVIAVLGAATPAAETRFYVSPSGNDADAGSLEKPFRTLERARDAMRASQKETPCGGAIILRGGRYHLAEPFVMGAVDSGGAGRTIAYRAYPGEVPVLVGGVPVTGWQPHEGKVWRARAPSIVGLKSGSFEILEDGVPAVIARSPNEGWFRLAGASVDPDFHLVYKPEDFDPPKVDVGVLQVHLIHMGSYFSEHIPVESIDPATRTFHTRHRMWDKFYYPVAGKCYQVENALALVDAPGEFFADTRTGCIYCYPRTDNPEDALIETSVAAAVVSVESALAGKPVHDLVFEGLTIQGGQSGFHTDGVADILIKDCQVFNAIGNGIDILGASTRVTVTGCEVACSGREGINLRGSYESPASGGKANGANRGHRIHNNYIHHAGRLSITGCGIMLANSTSGNTISHNLVTDTAKAGIQMFSMWDVPREWAVMNDNVIEHNELARCVTRGWDGGAFYIGATTDNTTFANNQVSDAWSYFIETWPQPEALPLDCCAVDFDPGMTFNTRIDNNMFHGANAATFENGRFEDETFLANNFFESPNRPGQVMFNGQWTSLAKVDPKPFDRSKVSMDFGLTGEYKHPYPKESARPVGFPLHCGFEGTLSPFFLYRYNDGLKSDLFTAAHAKGGKTALEVDKDIFCVRYRHPSLLNKRVSVWMYDDPAKKHARCGVTLAGPDGATVFLGVDGAVSATKYVFRAGDAAKKSRSRRKAGWHELVFDFVSRPDGGCRMSIDGRDAGESPRPAQFHTIDIGDPDFGSDSRGMTFDDLKIE